MTNYDWNFASLLPYWKPLLKGLEITVLLTLLTAIIGTPLGFLLGFLLRAKLAVARWPLALVVDVFRSMPMLVLLLATNYFLPILIGRPSLSPFSIALIALSVNLTVFVADVVRGTVDNVPIGEIEAARAIGFCERDVLARFIIPRVFQLSLPTLALLYIATAKNSSLASTIAVYELTYTANLIVTEKMRTLEVFALVALIYVVLILPFSFLAHRLEISKNISVEEAG
jgi:polar amino acid transport system permease protein